jgi:hypothetical protein
VLTISFIPSSSFHLYKTPLTYRKGGNNVKQIKWSTSSYMFYCANSSHLFFCMYGFISPLHPFKFSILITKWRLQQTLLLRSIRYLAVDIVVSPSLVENICPERRWCRPKHAKEVGCCEIGSLGCGDRGRFEAQYILMAMLPKAAKHDKEVEGSNWACGGKGDYLASLYQLLSCRIITFELTQLWNIYQPQSVHEP